VTAESGRTAWQVWAQTFKDMTVDSKAALDLREYTTWVKMVRVWATNEELVLDLEAWGGEDAA
jgi:hypothetical protein